MISAGRLRHRVDIQKPTFTQDPYSGAPTATVWENVYTSLPADVYPLSSQQYAAREFEAANQIQSRIIARITIRFKADIEADWRILHRGKIYNIQGLLADNDSGIEYLTIPVSSGTNEG